MIPVQINAAPIAPRFAPTALLAPGQRSFADTYVNLMSGMRIGCSLPTGNVLRFAESSEIVVRMMAGRSGGSSGGNEVPPPSGGSDGDGRGRGPRKKLHATARGAAPMPPGGDKSRPVRSPFPQPLTASQMEHLKANSNSDRFDLVKELRESPSAKALLEAALSLVKPGKKVCLAEGAIIPELTNEEDPTVRVVLMGLAASIKSHNTARRVSDSLTSANEAVRLAAALALGEMGEFAINNLLAGGSTILDKLTNVSLHDKSQHVRFATECALRKLGV